MKSHLCTVIIARNRVQWFLQVRYMPHAGLITSTLLHLVCGATLILSRGLILGQYIIVLWKIILSPFLPVKMSFPGSIMERVWQTFATIRRSASGSIWGTVSPVAGTPLCIWPAHLLRLYNGVSYRFFVFWINMRYSILRFAPASPLPNCDIMCRLKSISSTWMGPIVLHRAISSSIGTRLSLL